MDAGQGHPSDADGRVMDAHVWILRGSYYAARWGEWLDARRAPGLSEWAEVRAERDTRLDCSSLAYRVPSQVPPISSDDEAWERVYDHIRLRLGMATRAS